MEKFDKTIIMLFIILLCITAINIYVYNSKILMPTLNNQKIIKAYEKYKLEKEELNNEEDEEIIENDETRLLELKSMAEGDRMLVYFSEYINYIDTEDYDKAYSLLNEEFKKSYFPTLDLFKEYIEKVYPKFFGINYDTIRRQGNYYIITYLIYDVETRDYSSYINQSVVIYEKDFDNFELSFQI